MIEIQLKVAQNAINTYFPEYKAYPSIVELSQFQKKANKLLLVFLIRILLFYNAIHNF